MRIHPSTVGLLFIATALHPGLAQSQPGRTSWQSEVAQRARMMSQVQWTPVADGMPHNHGTFKQGEPYTGVPYSSVKERGRDIGYDIYLKTFLAAVENPKSVLYTQNLGSHLNNAECFYGKVCSTYTSYALGCGNWIVSRRHGPEHRDGIARIDPPTAQKAEVGDLIFRPPGRGAHIEIVTDIVRDDSGRITHVRVEESRPPTTRTTLYNAEDFNAHLGERNRELLRVTNPEQWLGANRSQSFRFPNFEEDSATPTINRTLLLDLGDWVAYEKGQPVRIHLMDRDRQGIQSLVIKRDGEQVERIPAKAGEVVERTFAECGNYTAHCVLADGSDSQACEFSVCHVGLKSAPATVSRGSDLELRFATDNADVIMIHVSNPPHPLARYNHFISAEDRRRGQTVVPGKMLLKPGQTQIWLVAENKYGRLKKRYDVRVK